MKRNNGEIKKLCGILVLTLPTYRDIERLLFIVIVYECA